MAWLTLYPCAQQRAMNKLGLSKLRLGGETRREESIFWGKVFLTTLIYMTSPIFHFPSGLSHLCFGRSRGVEDRGEAVWHPSNKRFTPGWTHPSPIESRAWAEGQWESLIPRDNLLETVVFIPVENKTVSRDSSVDRMSPRPAQKLTTICSFL